MQFAKKHGVMVKVLDSGLEVSEFKLQLRYYVHFWRDNFKQVMNCLIPSAMG